MANEEHLRADLNASFLPSDYAGLVDTVVDEKSILFQIATVLNTNAKEVRVPLWIDDPNSDFSAGQAVHVELGDEVAGATILGNRFGGDARILDRTYYPVHIDHTPLSVDALPAYDHRFPVIRAGGRALGVGPQPHQHLTKTQGRGFIPGVMFQELVI